MLAPLRQADFVSFGRVIESAGAPATSVNQGRATRFDPEVDLAEMDGEGRLAFAIYRVAASTPPLLAPVFERHPHSAQMFAPMTGGALAIVVAPDAPDGSPDISRARAFAGSQGQGVVYRRNVWHHPLIALRVEADFAMLMRERGGGADTVEHWLSQPLIVG